MVMASTQPRFKPFLGELQYKFILDEQGVEESFESGDPCTTTVDIYTNRVLQVEGNMTLEPVCL